MMASCAANGRHIAVSCIVSGILDVASFTLASNPTLYPGTGASELCYSRLRYVVRQFVMVLLCGKCGYGTLSGRRTGWSVAATSLISMATYLPLHVNEQANPGASAGFSAMCAIPTSDALTGTDSLLSSRGVSLLRGTTICEEKCGRWWQFAVPTSATMLS